MIYFLAPFRQRPVTNMPRSLRVRSLLILAATAGYWLLIFGGTHAPGNTGPGYGNSDKLAHFGAFCGLAFLLCGSVASFRRLGPASYGAIIGLAACYGIIDELTQMLVANRTADVLDWLADITGALVGALFFALGTQLFQPRNNAHGATGKIVGGELESGELSTPCRTSSWSNAGEKRGSKP
jgi:VanZ family protein